MEIDLNYVSDHGRSIVDIVVAMDVSSSISDHEFEEAKVFFKNLLEYFSIAPAHGQVSKYILVKVCAVNVLGTPLSLSKVEIKLNNLWFKVMQKQVSSLFE